MYTLGIITLVSAIGMMLILKKSLPHRLLSVLIALGAGSMLAVSILHILPETLHHASYGVLVFLWGFVLMYFLEEMLSLHAHHAPHHDHSHEDPHAHSHHVALIACVALIIHTLFDGMAIRAAREVSDMLSYGVLFGVVIHQIPMSLSLAAILKKSQVSRQMQIICMLIFSVSIAFGYMLAHLFLQHWGQSFAIYATALAGGSLLYIATVDLLPMTHSESHRKLPIIVSFCFGITLMAALSLWDEDIHSHHMSDESHNHMMHHNISESGYEHSEHHSWEADVLRHAQSHHESIGGHYQDTESHHDDHDH